MLIRDRLKEPQKEGIREIGKEKEDKRGGRTLANSLLQLVQWAAQPVMTWLEDKFKLVERTPATEPTRRKKNATDRLARKDNEVWRVVFVALEDTAGDRGMGR